MLSLLPLAVDFELRSLLRKRAGAVAMAAYLLLGAVSVFLGQRHVAGWQQAVETAQQAQEASVEEARGYLARGEGPEDRPWVDLAQPRWQDSYAGTRVHRTPGPLAGIAAGAVDPAPVAFSVTRRADPLAGAGHRIENPELALGAMDLSFVLALLSPLLLGVLGVGIGGQERQDRTDRLLQVQAGDAHRWLLARLVAVTGAVAACNAVLCGAAGLLGGASGSQLATLVALGVGYAALWGGVLATVSAAAQTVRAGALAYGTAWMALGLVLPSLAAEASLAGVQTDYGVAETLGARTLGYAAYDLALDDVTTQVYARYPALADLPAARTDPLDPQARRHATEAVLVFATADRVVARQQDAQAAQRVADAAAWASPAVALTLALERLAGVGPEAAVAFQAHALAAVEQRVQWVLDRAWRTAPLTADDFEALVAAAPAPFQPDAGAVAGPGLALAAWTGAAWILALVGFRRRDGAVR